MGPDRLCQAPLITKKQAKTRIYGTDEGDRVSLSREKKVVANGGNRVNGSQRAPKR